MIVIFIDSQNAVRASKTIPVSTLTRWQAGESIPVQKWNSPHGGQVHYTDTAAGASNDRRRRSVL